MKSQQRDSKTRMKIEFLSGMSGALVSTTLLQPVDIARTRYSVQAMSLQRNKYIGFSHTFRTII